MADSRTQISDVTRSWWFLAAAAVSAVATLTGCAGDPAGAAPAPITGTWTLLTYDASTLPKLLPSSLLNQNGGGTATLQLTGEELRLAADGTYMRQTNLVTITRWQPGTSIVRPPGDSVALPSAALEVGTYTRSGDVVRLRTLNYDVGDLQRIDGELRGAVLGHVYRYAR